VPPVPLVGVGERRGFEVGEAPGDAPGEGLVPGVKFGGPMKAELSTTRSAACAWQVPFQQSFTVWSPSGVSLGTRISRVTLPLPSARNGNTLSRLRSWTSPA
jgi:hypothetical protein